jgi:ribose transport system substrate-binding protein
VAAGCGSSESGAGASAGAKQYVVAVIPKGETHDFWKAIHAGAIHAGRELGNVEVRWQGPLREDDREQQVQIVESFIAQGVDGIVLAPLDRGTLAAPVNSAVAGGIPVLIIDSGLDSDRIVSYVATDNFNGGALAARRLGELLGGKGNAILVPYQVGSESTEQRERGFLETLAKEFPDIRVISADQHAGPTRESATQTMENLLSRFGDEVDGVFAPCEPVAFGCMRALEESGKAGSIKLVGFDATAELVTALGEGKLHGLVLQDPFKMGDLGVRMMVDHLEGRAVARRVPTGEVMVTAENMDQPEMIRLHSPDLKPYLGG